MFPIFPFDHLGTLHNPPPSRRSRHLCPNISTGCLRSTGCRRTPRNSSSSSFCNFRQFPRGASGPSGRLRWKLPMWIWKSYIDHHRPSPLRIRSRVKNSVYISDHFRWSCRTFVGTLWVLSITLSIPLAVQDALRCSGRRVFILHHTWLNSQKKVPSPQLT